MPKSSLFQFNQLLLYIPKTFRTPLVINNVYEEDFAAKGDGRKDVLIKIEELNKKRGNARELLLKGDLDGNDYRVIKLECESKINALEAKLADLSRNNSNIERELDKAVTVLTNLDVLYQISNMNVRREIIGSMYPEKFTFQDIQHRTARVNEVASLIYQISNELTAKKEWASDDKTCLPTWVRPPGLEPYAVIS